MTVSQLLSNIDSKELSEWMAFFQAEPFGEQRADLRSALISCVMANAWRGKKQKAFKLDDFILNFEPPKKMDVEDMKQILKGLCR